MQIQQLTYFVAIAEQGSINKAAEKLFVTQPNLSKAISNLENELKVRIFNRTNKGRCADRRGQKSSTSTRARSSTRWSSFACRRRSTRRCCPSRLIRSSRWGVWWRSSTNDYHDNRVALKAGGKTACSR